MRRVPPWEKEARAIAEVARRVIDHLREVGIAVDTARAGDPAPVEEFDAAVSLEHEAFDRYVAWLKTYEQRLREQHGSARRWAGDSARWSVFRLGLYHLLWSVALMRVSLRLAIEGVLTEDGWSIGEDGSAGWWKQDRSGALSWEVVRPEDDDATPALAPALDLAVEQAAGAMGLVLDTPSMTPEYIFVVGDVLKARDEDFARRFLPVYNAVIRLYGERHPEHGMKPIGRGLREDA